MPRVSRTPSSYLPTARSSCSKLPEVSRSMVSSIWNPDMVMYLSNTGEEKDELNTRGSLSPEKALLSLGTALPDAKPLLLPDGARRVRASKCPKHLLTTVVLPDAPAPELWDRREIWKIRRRLPFLIKVTEARLHLPFLLAVKTVATSGATAAILGHGTESGGASQALRTVEQRSEATAATAARFPVTGP